MSVLLKEKLPETFAHAVSLHQAGHAAEAEAAYRALIEALPDCAPALNNLGLLVGTEESVALFHRAVAAEPDYVDALVNLSGALYGLDDLRGADLFYQRALSLIPAEEDALLRLGRILQAQGRLEDAACQYERVIALNPANTVALANLADIHNNANRPAAAARCLRQALLADPASDVLNHNLVVVLKQQGRLDEAAEHSQRLARPQPLDIQPASYTRRTVLLASGLVGNVPWHTLMPHGTTTITWQVEYATDAQERDLPPHATAFNAIGNADVLDESFARLASFHSRRPMLNSPAAVARTRRDKMPALLRSIAGAVVPAVIRVERVAFSQPGLPERLAEAGLAFPVLVRPIVGHGGDGMRRVNSATELEQTDFGAADAYYITAYHDYQSADGYYRKYRMIFVDGAPFAYHLAISPTWLVHYFSADMLAAPWKRDEEQAFLENPVAVLGGSTMATIEAIGRQTGLDYAGLDFSVLPDGRVLVFEANATMLVHLNDSLADFPYKHACVPAITRAFADMLDRHAQM